jgi:hypothetical protein
LDPTQKARIIGMKISRSPEAKRVRKRVKLIIGR